MSLGSKGPRGAPGDGNIVGYDAGTTRVTPGASAGVSSILPGHQGQPDNVRLGPGMATVSPQCRELPLSFESTLIIMITTKDSNSSNNIIVDVNDGTHSVVQWH